MKPRRWYSSTEINPQLQIPPVRPLPDIRYWYYTSKPGKQQGPVVKRFRWPKPTTPLHCATV
ncbi:hypothetical protein HC891_12590 [Candidatus Gracilibacteria bacterium]|nr:hypothetical protein [Candidatus Gracilibacteria bacterium]